MIKGGHTHIKPVDVRAAKASARRRRDLDKQSAAWKYSWDTLVRQHELRLKWAKVDYFIQGTAFGMLLFMAVAMLSWVL